MSEPPLVSVITPSYNQAEYLELTIRSVLAQLPDKQAGFNLEYLIVDGGSDDGSQDIIQKYATHLAWWISEPDSGQAEAINKGFLKSRGEIIAWLNSDDLYMPGAIARAVHSMQKNDNAGMLFGDAIAIDSTGQPLNKWTFGNWGLAELMRFRVICQPAVFIRRTVLEQAGMLDISYHYMLDHKFWLQIARVSPILHIPETWAAARTHAGAKNVNLAYQFGEEIFRILDWVKTQPDLAPLEKANRRKIEAGAWRLNARYLLDGNLPTPALKAYMQALLRDPAFALKHWHRMVYAVLCLLGGQRMAGWYFRLRPNRQPSLTEFAGLANWPGISIKNNFRD
jgi:glycosyltransferase involved in cell wall biosynthesis